MTAPILQRLHRDERGLTLVELMVAMSMSIIIIIAVGGFFLASTKAAKTDSTSETSMRQASNMMDAMTQYVHAATVLPVSGGSPAAAVEVAMPTDLVFYAYVNLTNGTVTQPVQVEYTLDGSNNLVEKIWNIASSTGGYFTFNSYTTAPDRTVVLGGPIASPTSDGTSLFTYLDANGNVVASPGTGLGLIRAVQVNLEVGSTTAGSAGDTHIQSTLYLFNVGYSATTASPSP